MRRALEALPDLLQATADDDGMVRSAAMSGLGQLAGAEEIPGMVEGVLRAPPGSGTPSRRTIAASRLQSSDERGRTRRTVVGRDDFPQ